MRFADGSEPWTADDCVSWLWLLAHTTQVDDFSFDSYIESDRRDAELMHALADMKRHMPDSKAVAHRMLDGRFGVPESILIDGFWVALG